MTNPKMKIFYADNETLQCIKEIKDKGFNLSFLIRTYLKHKAASLRNENVEEFPKEELK